MKNFLSCLLSFIIFHASAQLRGTGVIVTVHPSIGNTVTLAEKQEFMLFPERPDSTFESACFVKYDDSTYTVLFKMTDQASLEKSITMNQMFQVHAQVESRKPALPGAVTAPPVKPDKSPPLEGVSDIVDDFSAAFVATLDFLFLWAN